MLMMNGRVFIYFADYHVIETKENFPDIYGTLYSTFYIDAIRSDSTLEQRFSRMQLVRNYNLHFRRVDDFQMTVLLVSPKTLKGTPLHFK